MKSIIKFLKTLFGLEDRPNDTYDVETVERRRPQLVEPQPVPEQPRDSFLRKAQHALQIAFDPKNVTPSQATGIYGGLITHAELRDFLDMYSSTEWRQLAMEHLLLNESERHILAFNLIGGDLSENHRFAVAGKGGIPVPYHFVEEVMVELAKANKIDVPAVGAVPHQGEVVTREVEPEPAPYVDTQLPEEHQVEDSLVEEFKANPVGLVRFPLTVHTTKQHEVMVVGRPGGIALESDVFESVFLANIPWVSFDLEEDRADYVYVTPGTLFRLRLAEQWGEFTLESETPDVWVQNTGDHHNPQPGDLIYNQQTGELSQVAIPEAPVEEPKLVLGETVAFSEPEPVVDPVLKAEAERYMSDGRYHLVKLLDEPEDQWLVRPATNDKLPWIPAHYFPNALVRGLETYTHYEERVRERKLGKKRLSARERKRLTQTKK